MINSDPNINNEQQKVELWMEVVFPQRIWVAVDGNVYKENQTPSDDWRILWTEFGILHESFPQGFKCVKIQAQNFFPWIYKLQSKGWDMPTTLMNWRLLRGLQVRTWSGWHLVFSLVIPWAEHMTTPCQTSDLWIGERIHVCCFKLVNSW